MCNGPFGATCVLFCLLGGVFVVGFAICVGLSGVLFYLLRCLRFLLSIVFFLLCVFCFVFCVVLSVVISLCGLRVSRLVVPGCLCCSIVWDRSGC